MYARLNSDLQLFVRVSAGIYGLLEWGLEHSPQVYGRGRTISELIEEFLVEKGEPCDFDVIAEHITARKRVTREAVLNELFHLPQFRGFTRTKFGLRAWKK